MTGKPPVTGEPLLSWEYHGRQCHVYHVDGYDPTKQHAVNELILSAVTT